MIFAVAEPILTTFQWIGLIVACTGGVTWLGALSTLSKIAEARGKRNERTIESHSVDIGKLYAVASTHETRHAVTDVKVAKLEAGP